jgi:tRNA1(Val) A37 N6-methylase TrmN6
MTGRTVDTPPSTVDAFHRGRFVLVQPERGHRAGMDALVLAADVPDGFSGMLADLGAGAGAAALAVLARCPSSRAVLVEREPVMAAFARATLSHPTNAAYAHRAHVLEADVAASGRARIAAGLDDRSFDAVIMNPPFNDPADRASPEPLRAAAHVGLSQANGADLVDAWLRTAAAILVPRGLVALIARPASLPSVVKAIDGRFGEVRIVPIMPRPDASAIRVVIVARQGARGALSIAAPLILHEREGNAPSRRAEAILNGQAQLLPE